VKGGVVHRGSAVPELATAYVLSDYCSGAVWSMPVDRSAVPIVVASRLGNISSFSMDVAGAVHVRVVDHTAGKPAGLGRAVSERVGF